MFSPSAVVLSWAAAFALIAGDSSDITQSMARNQILVRIHPEDLAMLDAYAGRTGQARNAAVISLIRDGAATTPKAEIRPAKLEGPISTPLKPRAKPTSAKPVDEFGSAPAETWRKIDPPGSRLKQTKKGKVP